MPRCRVKHREKLYYTRQERGGRGGQREAEEKLGSAGENHMQGGGVKREKYAEIKGALVDLWFAILSSLPAVLHCISRMEM